MSRWSPRRPSGIEPGREPLDDELLPNRGRPVRQRWEGGDEPDTAGQHGEMAVETAAALVLPQPPG